MNNIGNISTALTTTLKDSDLQGVTTEWSEIFLDNFLAEGVLKEIPIINTIIGIGKAGIKVNEALFLKKLLSFISNINDVSVEERAKMISEIDESHHYRIKIGEKLLYIIDKCDDHEKSALVGKLFNSFLRGLIDYDDFLRCSLVIEKCMVNDLKWFIKDETTTYQMRYDAEFFNWGLLEFAPLELKIAEKRDGKNGYEITEKELKLKISNSGEIIRTHLKEYVNKQFKELKLTEMTYLNLKNYIFALAKENEKVQNKEKLYVNFTDVICEICNNYILNESEIKTVLTDIMIIMGKYTINYITGQVEKKAEEQDINGNDFNLDRWKKFSANFIIEHDIKDYRQNGL